MSRRFCPHTLGSNIDNWRGGGLTGADGVWMGSRFIVTPEANAPMELKEALLEATSDETVHTRLYTGRTLRALANPWHAEWEG